MIPILYDKNEKEFKSNGIGRLSETITCIVTEEKNGIYELEMTYPITGTYFKSIVPGTYLKAINGNPSNKQLFNVYKTTKPINGIVTIYAHHISYALNKIVVSPFHASNAVEAFDKLNENASTECNFVFWTDKVSDGDFDLEVPSSIRSKLGGSEGSILDIYGGEYEFDNYMIRLWNKRGRDRGVVLRYGKNITDISQEENILNTITGVYPYWKKNDTYYELPDKVVLSENASNFPEPLVIPLDCSNDFEEKPSEQELIERAEKYLLNSNAGVPKVNISVSFIDLTKTEEYKDIARLEEIELCDDVTVYFEKLNISTVAEVVETKYNVLKEQYDMLQVGEVKANLASSIANQSAQIKEKASQSFLEAAIKNATNIITGVDGGYVIFHQDGNGRPYELLIMDTDSIETAKNVWRFNKNGWGYSSNGYNGPYTLAATLDGGFVADFITTGTMMANRIKGGTLTLGGVNNGDGIASVLSSNGNEVVRLSKDGISTSNAIITGGDISLVGENPNGSVLRITGSGFEVFLSPANFSMRHTNGSSTNVNAGSITVNDSGQGVLNVNRANTYIYSKKTVVEGSFSVTGTKSRISKTKNYNDRALYCYEMTSPIFGDVGHGIIGEDGLCYVDIDQIFFETIDTNQSYNVFLQSYSESTVYVKEKQNGYFVVKGIPHTEFDWEVKAKQLDFPMKRLEENLQEDDYKETDYIMLANEYLINYERELLNYE